MSSNSADKHTTVPLQAHAAALAEVADVTHTRLAGWRQQRHHAECSAVAALHHIASQAAYAGQPLPHALKLQVSLSVRCEMT